MKPQIITKSVYTWGTACCFNFRDLVNHQFIRIGEREDGTPMVQIVSINGETSYPLKCCPFCKADINYEKASN